MIFIRIPPQRFGDKLMPRHIAHRAKHTGVANTTLGKLRPHHSLALCPERVDLRSEVHAVANV